MLKVRDISAQRGGKKCGYIEIGETTNGPLRLPIAILHGAVEGPVLCITAGVHATEYPPIGAAMRLIRELQPDRLRGSVVIVPVASMAMYQGRLPFVSPIDGLNLNKINPVQPGGSASEVLAEVLLTEVIRLASHHIDLHAGDFGEHLLPFAGFPITGKAQVDQCAEAMARLFSPGIVSMSPATGSLLPSYAGGIVQASMALGVTSILGESDGDGGLGEPDVAIHFDGVMNVMRYLKMLDGDPIITGARWKAIDRFVIRAKRAGLVHMKAKLGVPVSQGQVLAEIVDVFGEVVEQVTSPRPGIPGMIWTRKVVNSSDPVVRCWTVEPAGPFPETDRFVRG